MAIHTSNEAALTSKQVDMVFIHILGSLASIEGQLEGIHTYKFTLSNLPLISILTCCKGQHTEQKA